MSGISSGLLDFIIHFISQNVIGSAIGGVLLVLFLAFRSWGIRKLKSLCSYFFILRNARKAVAQKYINGTLREGDGLWIAEPIHQPESYETKIAAAKILSIANLKGGVGKTTITSNLGACLSKKINEGLPIDERKPVLLIDLDFQGTLSGMAIPNTEIWPPRSNDSHSTRLISNKINADNLVDLNYVADDRELLKIIPSYYELAQAENRLMVEWLLSNRNFDVRYSLANILHHPQIRKRFSLIIIDCPPRLTTATIQALCASSHLLIPTIMDKASYEAVNSFSRQVETFKKKQLCPHIQHIGVVGSITNPNGNFAENIFELQDLLNASWQNGGVDGQVQILDSNTFIPKYKRIADNFGRGIIYPTVGNDLPSQTINERFENLSNIVKNKMQL